MVNGFYLLTIVCRGPVYAMFVLWGMDMTKIWKGLSPHKIPATLEYPREV